MALSANYALNGHINIEPDDTEDTNYQSSSCVSQNIVLESRNGVTFEITIPINVAKHWNRSYCGVLFDLCEQPWEIADWTILTIMKNTMQWNSGSKIWQNRHIQTVRAPLRILDSTRNPTKQLVGDLMLVDVLIWWSFFWCCSELYTALVRWKRQTARAEKKTQIMDLVCNDR